MHDRRAGGDPHRQHERVGVQHLADDDARRDPADRAEHADDREVARRILHVMERDRIGQRQRRHVAERVQNQQRIERREVVCIDTAHITTPPTQMQHREQLLAGEEPVGHHAR